MHQRNRRRISAIIITAAIILNSVPVYASATGEDILYDAADTVLLKDEGQNSGETPYSGLTQESVSVSTGAEDIEGDILLKEDNLPVISGVPDVPDGSTDTQGYDDADGSEDPETPGESILSDDEKEGPASSISAAGDGTDREADTAAGKDKEALLPDEEDGLTGGADNEENSMGEMPVERQIEPENPSHNGRKLFSKYSAEGADPLPESFIPSDLPELRNQNPYPTCWSFTSIALAEMSLIRQGKVSVGDMNSLDLSELHLAFFSYNTVTDPLGGTKGDNNTLTRSSFLNSGGNREFTKNILAAWTGPADEDTVPYDRAAEVARDGLDSELAFLSSAHLRNYYDISLFTTDKDGKRTGLDENGMRAAKELIRSNGAVGLSFKAVSASSAATDKKYYNEDNNCYYDPNEGSTNHSVTIVGWDDNFDRNRFTTVPEGDGAWLVRNSWKKGGSYEDSQCYAGYFWLSYYNMNTGKTAHAFVFDTADDHYNNYQYDGGMGTWYTKYSKAANVFKAHAAKNTWEYEKVKAASFYTNASNVDYTIDVYTRLKDAGDPESGKLRSTTRGTTTYAGYYTVPLSSEVAVDEGESFSVVVTLNKTDGNPYIGVEYSEDKASWYRIQTAADKGQSFVYVESEDKWIDYGYTDDANIKIKAFTDLAEKEGRFKISFADGRQGERFREYDYTGTAVKPEMDVRCDDIVLTEGEDYTVSYKNNTDVCTPASPSVTGSKDPQVIINLKGDYSGKYIRNFKINSVDMSEYHEVGRITASEATASVKKNSRGEYMIQKLVPDVYYGNVKLTKGTDYVLAYDDDREGAYREPCPSSDPWKITVKGIGNNFSGSFTTGEILKDNGGTACIPLSDKSVKVTLSSSSSVYGGRLPDYTLTYTDPSDKSRTPYILTEGVDYLVKAYNTDTVGRAQYVFTAAPDSDRFTGSTGKTFKINKASMPKIKAEVRLIPEEGSLSGSSYTYVKGGVKPSVEVMFTDDYGNKRVLRKGTDYKLTYGYFNVIRNRDEKNAPYVKITGMGCFSGSLKTAYSIVRGDIEALLEPSVPDVVWSKTKNAFKKTDVVLIDSNGERLVKNTDYMITDFVTEDGTLTPAVGTRVFAVIQGKGRYSGSVNISYGVNSGDISKTAITFYEDDYMDDKVSGYTYTGREIRPEYISIRTTGKDPVVLTEGIDYTIAGYYDNINVGKGCIAIRGMGQYAGLKIFKFRITARKYVK